MTREEAIKNIKEHCYFANLIPQAKEALDMAIKALEQDTVSKESYDHEYFLRKELEIYKLKQQEPKWTPVSEKLPKAGEYVGNVAKHYLVQNEFGDMLVARYTNSGYWEQIYQLNPIADEIIAWRDLPQPYKAESEGK